MPFTLITVPLLLAGLAPTEPAESDPTRPPETTEASGASVDEDEDASAPDDSTSGTEDEPTATTTTEAKTTTGTTGTGTTDGDGDDDEIHTYEELLDKDDNSPACERTLRRARDKRAKRKSRAAYRCQRSKIWKEEGKRIDAETHTFRGRMSPARASRCATAICWGPSNRWAFEPLAEIPVGKTFAFPGSGVGRFINGNGIDVRFDAGFRFWFAYDWVSIGVYLSTPKFTGSKETIRASGSQFEYPVSLVRRPAPGLAVGLFGDLVWVGVDYNQLRNGSSESTRNPAFPANEIVSHAASITIAIAPLAGFRNGIGTAVEMKRREEAKKAKEKAKEEIAKEEAAKKEKAAKEAAAKRKAAEEEAAKVEDATATDATTPADDATAPEETNPGAASAV